MTRVDEHQDKVALGDSCRQFTGRSTEVEDMMASSEDKNATEDLNRDFHIQEQRYDSQWTEDEFGDLL